jgi:hypothetical protein
LPLKKYGTDVSCENGKERKVSDNKFASF